MIPVADRDLGSGTLALSVRQRKLLKTKLADEAGIEPTTPGLEVAGQPISDIDCGLLGNARDAVFMQVSCVFQLLLRTAVCCLGSLVFSPISG